ncbi:urea amidohydrolase (urease) alpha subunit [Fusarium phyllophilum]|uniref:urease n=1 Tax=Fusarium phyllophilum TaxID=47803 RepID=A0A8H5ITU4_9HYPO|nr:urea amidohydrolase (urease) alpha subunit [Fusarium phyllophilum]
MHFTPREIIHNEDYSVADLMKLGKRILGRRNVHPSVVGTLKQMQAKGTFETGTHLITIHNPISTDDGDSKIALSGSFLLVPSDDLFPAINEADFHPSEMPGTILPADTGDIIFNTNKGTQAVHIYSHFHFMETNPDLDFDRQKAYGYHLDLPAGEITQGGSGYAKGPTGYRHSLQESSKCKAVQPCSISREKYASAYGPTTGDLIRLGSTDLWVRIEKDYTSYGDECTLGCGKTVRDGMGAASGCSGTECLDLAIINAVIIDWTGTFKADIGVKDGVIFGIGKEQRLHVLLWDDQDVRLGRIELDRSLAVFIHQLSTKPPLITHLILTTPSRREIYQLNTLPLMNRPSSQQLPPFYPTRARPHILKHLPLAVSPLPRNCSSLNLLTLPTAQHQSFWARLLSQIRGYSATVNSMSMD